MGNVWEDVVPRLNFNMDRAAQEKAKFERLHNKIGGEPNGEGVPNDKVPCPPGSGRHCNVYVTTSRIKPGPSMMRWLPLVWT
jgi:hypothetical protein